MNPLSPRGLVLAACLAASHGAIAAEPSTASAAASNFRYELIDLTPDDGSAPWIDFTNRQSGMAIDIHTRTYPYDVEYKWTHEFKELELTIGDNHVWGAASLTGASSRITASDRAGWASIQSEHTFVLSPNTEVRFWTDVSVAGFANPGDEEVMAAAGLSGYFSDQVLGLQSLNAPLVAEGTETEYGTVLSSARTTGQQGEGYVYIFANARVSPALAVPEPGRNAMLLAGLALLGGALWRRRAGAFAPVAAGA